MHVEHERLSTLWNGALLSQDFLCIKLWSFLSPPLNMVFAASVIMDPSTGLSMACGVFGDRI